MNDNNLSEYMPVLALRGLTVFPNMLLHFDVGRDKSISALNEASPSEQKIFLVSQRDILADAPSVKDLFSVGTISSVRQVLRLPGDTVRVMVEGHSRGRVINMVQEEPYLYAAIEELPLIVVNKDSARVEALIRQCYELFEEYLSLSPRILADNLLNVLSSDDPGYIADLITQNIPVKYIEKQMILEELRPIARIEKVIKILRKEIQVLTLENNIQEKVQTNLTKNQRDYILREQMKVIQDELGEDEDNEIEAYRKKIKALKLTSEVEEKLLKEVSRLAKQQFGSSESAVIRNYLDICIDLPWHKKTKERVDVEAARKILDADHYGLDKVKERILEFLAVKALAPDIKGQILCLVGPPGVGKTSIAMSIARALNRKLARLSLGGVRDEADIRGHRKTYVGAMPGRIITSIKQADSNNPLLLLDEIDKLGSDYRGDPSAALLEVLDQEQNHEFRDHYLEIPFNLSNVMFITTANTTSTIPRALLDRMEVIELGSYTDEEKLQIAKSHLLPKQLHKHGIKKSMLKLSDDAIREIIACYTRESGVRNLERELAAVCRKAAKRFVTDGVKHITVNANRIEDMLGPRKYKPERMRRTDEIGVVNGLAWTSAGGELLEVEANVVEGTGKLELTGNLGDVMKESAKAAMSYIRSRVKTFSINPDFYKTKDIHVHFPEGAVPKDGPSAGITVCTAMVSALVGAPVRRNIAMTGEISLRGRVLPIGGLKEKTMAALRNGIKTVIIPADNEKDLEEIDPIVRNALSFITVEHVDSVITAAIDFSKCVKDAKTAEIALDINSEPFPTVGPVLQQ